METLKIRSPYEGTELGELPLLTAPEVEVAIRTAERTFANRKHWLPLHERLEILRHVAEMIQEQTEDLTRTIVREGGKPWRDSLLEVQRGIQGIRSAITTMSGLGGCEVPMGQTVGTMNHYAVTIREPAGVVFAISAFNHPFNMIIHQVIPCIATGCPVLIKPALATPLSCQRLVDLLYEAGLPTAWCQMIICDNNLTAKTAQDPRFALVSFIGSSDIGWQIRSKLAPGVQCVLEHGGAAPVVALKDADICDMLPRLIKGGFYHAGQVCVSVQRVFVPGALFEEITHGLSELADRQIVGDPLDQNTDVGPLIRSDSVDKIEKWVQEAGHVITGGKRLTNNCYAPTILADPSNEARVSTNEIFGPVICVYRYDELNEAIHRANALPFAFHAAVFGQSRDALLHTAHRLNATTVMLNDHTAFRADWMPFGGRKLSGMGTGGIPYTISELFPVKLLVSRFSIS